MRVGPLVCVTGVLLFLGGCVEQAPFQISNDTAQVVTLAGCAQERELQRIIPSQGRFTFDDSVGGRTLSDDPGFSCLLDFGGGDLRCLTLPTDQAEKTVFSVREAVRVDSFDTCVAKSEPHL